MIQPAPYTVSVYVFSFQFESQSGQSKLPNLRIVGSIPIARSTHVSGRSQKSLISHNLIAVVFANPFFDFFPNANSHLTATIRFTLRH
jgi:hypothetical protein